MREFEPWIVPSHTWRGWPSGSRGWRSSPIETPAEPSARLRAHTKRQTENRANRWLAVTQQLRSGWLNAARLTLKDRPTWSVTEEGVWRRISGQHPLEPIPWETTAGAAAAAAAVVMISTSSTFSTNRNKHYLYNTHNTFQRQTFISF